MSSATITPYECDILSTYIDELCGMQLDQAHLQALPAIPGLNIWSAACSTGQEVYSIAISLQELLAALRCSRVRILGTSCRSRCRTGRCWN